MKKFIIAWIVALLLVFNMSIGAYAANPVSEARNGVAVIATFEKSDSSLDITGWGSCFFIGKEGEHPKYLLTNHHVVDDYLKYGAGAVKTYTVNGVTFSSKMILRVYFGSNDYEEAYVVKTDEAQDIAILRLASPTEKRIALPLAAPTDEMIGKQIYAIGFPSYADIVDATSSWNAKDALVTNGSISRFVTTSGTGTQWIQVAATEWGAGNSGGPLVTEDGAVIGLVSHSQSDFANTIYMGVDIEPVFSMLKTSGIEFDLFEDRVKQETAEETAAPETPAPAAESATPAPTPAPATPTPEVTEAPATPAPAAETPASTGINVNGFQIKPWMIAAAAGVLAVVVLLIVLTKKKPSGGSSSIGSAGKKAYIRSLAAQHNGLRVQVGKEPITIGRQESCGIRFQANTPGVSGMHCSVSYDASSNEFILTDLKSSYGTFLETGQRLTPHTPTRLRSGDSFYAGDRRNILRVESNDK